METPHISVLRDEVVHLFSAGPLYTFIDGTLGAGGHAEALIKAHPELKQVIGIDQDPVALAIAEERLKGCPIMRFVRGNFSALGEMGLPSADGILLDLGVSSMQFDRPEKGFSFMHDGPLDMRMDPDNPLTAEEIINFYPEEQLGRIFRDFGEEKFWRLAAKAIASERAKRPIKTTKQLAALLEGALPFKKKGIHPVTLIFQGLRIFVNRELEVLEAAIPQAIKLLNPGGILAIISFHSLEDRIVKNNFRHLASDKWSTSGFRGVFLDKKPEVELITRKAIAPSEQEMQRNPRSRSAKLRAVKKV